MIPALESLGPVAGGLVLYTLSGIAKNRRKEGSDNFQIDPLKVIAAGVVATIVYGLALSTGTTPSEAELHAELAAYAGAIAVLKHFLEAALPPSWVKALRARASVSASSGNSSDPDDDQNDDQDSDSSQTQSRDLPLRYSGPETDAGLHHVDPDRPNDRPDEREDDPDTDRSR